jgi:hypothetical protein
MKTKKAPQPADIMKINDAFSLESATILTHDPVAIPVWDEGWGPLWVVMQSCGNFSLPAGLIRARTWEEAWEAAIDEVFASPDEDELAKYQKAMEENGTDDLPDLPDGWQYRGSGSPSNEKTFPAVSGYLCDTSDCTLDRLTMDIVKEHNIKPLFTL